MFAIWFMLFPFTQLRRMSSQHENLQGYNYHLSNHSSWQSQVPFEFELCFQETRSRLDRLLLFELGVAVIFISPAHWFCAWNAFCCQQRKETFERKLNRVSGERTINNSWRCFPNAAKFNFARWCSHSVFCWLISYNTYARRRESRGLHFCSSLPLSLNELDPREWHKQYYIFYFAAGESPHQQVDN
jgi:hypothetical protein